MELSINKYISDSGYCSRREADKLIEQGRVMINDNVALKGNRVLAGDKVYVDEELLKSTAKPVYIAFNKPKGITCTTDTSDPNSIINFLRYKQRIFPIGRLDKLSDGLIFLTNDGNIVNKILRCENGHQKHYSVTVDKPITAEFIQKMSNGVKIDGKVFTKRCVVTQRGRNSFTIVLKQGLNRQIRKMCEALGVRAVTLTRTRIMHISLNGIAPGGWRYFTNEELLQLEKLIANSSNEAT
jgi:23S rRNA pseudouridine2604 synthase